MYTSGTSVALRRLLCALAVCGVAGCAGIRGETTPAAARLVTETFAVPSSDPSIQMDFAASRGYDAHFVDVRGYGCSSRPPAMSQPPEATMPRLLPMAES